MTTVENTISTVVAKVRKEISALDTAEAIVICERYDGQYTVFATDRKLTAFGPTFAYLYGTEAGALSIYLTDDAGRDRSRWSDLTGDQARGVLHTQLPIEWHKAGDEFVAPRVQVFFLPQPQLMQLEQAQTAALDCSYSEVLQDLMEQLESSRDAMKTAHLTIALEVIAARYEALSK